MRVNKIAEITVIMCTWIVHYTYIITQVLNGVLQYYCNTVMSHFSMVLNHNLQHYCNGHCLSQHTLQ